MIPFPWKGNPVQSTAVTDDQRRVLFRLAAEPESVHLLEDAEHWRNVYRELVVGYRYVAGIEGTTRRRSRRLQLQRVEDRLRHWQSVVERLSRVAGVPRH